MIVTINGFSKEIGERKSVLAFLIEESLTPERVAVERNGSIVSKASYDTTILQDGDVLEVVSFVGGG